MSDWIRGWGVKLLRTFFVLGGVAAAVVLARGNFAGTKPLLMSGLVGISAIVIALTARIIIAISKHFMSEEDHLRMRWDEQNQDTFAELGVAVRIAFITGQLGLWSAAFAFGWTLYSMIFVLL